MAAALRTPSRDLPMDMLIGILARLPSKSLLRFRCVCKSWRDLISDRKFIEHHRNQNSNGHVLIEYVENNSSEYRLSLHCDKTFVEQTRLEHPIGEFQIFGHSNGLVCYSVRHPLEPVEPDEFDLYLWNPSIRKSKLLPKSQSPFDEHVIGAILAFGFVPQLNDYRVLKTVDQDYLDKKIFRENGVYFEIYSMRTNSWKMLDGVVHYQLHDNTIRLIKVMNGVVYLKANDNKDEDEDDYEEIILYFDMANEVFGKINIPQFSRIYSRQEGIHHIVLGKLGMFFILCYYKGNVADIWTKLKEHDAAESWTKTLTFDNWSRALGFLKNDELVLKYRNRLTVYDPRLPELKDLEFDLGPWSVYAFNYYAESLVLLNDGI